jgi:hypothetical protein
MSRALVEGSSMRRSSSWEGLSIESTPIDPTEAIVTVVASGDEAGRPFATAMATMQRPRRAEHEELWAHFFVDGVFVDIARVLEIDQGTAGDSLFVAKFRMPDLHFDGEPHTEMIRFVSAVSRIVPRGTGEQVMAQAQTAPTAEGVSEFTATLAAPRSRRLRDAR